MTSILRTVTSAVQKEFAFNSLCRKMAKDNRSLAWAYAKSAFARSVTNPTTPLAFKDRCVNLIKAPLLLLRASLLCLPATNRVTQLGLRLLSPQLTADFVKLSPFCFTKAELKIRYNSNTISEFAIARLTYAAEELLEKNIQANNEFNPEIFTNKHLLDAYIKLSPPLSIDFINSPKFEEKEAKARYSEVTRREFVESLIEEKISGKVDCKLQITEEDLALSNEEQTAIAKLGFTTEDYFNISLRFSPPKSPIICIKLSSPEKEVNIGHNQELITALKNHIQNEKPTKENITANCKKFGICDEENIKEIHKSIVIPYIQSQLEDQKSKKEPELKLSCFTKLGLSTNEEIQPIIQALKNNAVSFKEHKSLFFYSLKSS